MSGANDNVLYEFSLSHFCEKARWALDHHQISYTLKTFSPGFHIPTVRRFGLASSTVPIYKSGDRVIQGSGAIIDHLDAACPPRSLTPSSSVEEAEARRLEAHFDLVFGDDLRRVAYAMLLPHRDVVIAMWTTDAPFWASWVYRLAWPKVETGLRKLYRMKPERVAASRAAMDSALEELDALVQARGPYLVGDRLSRADIAASALLSPLVGPPERPWQSPVEAPGELGVLQNSYVDRPFWKWVEERYRNDRPTKQG